MFLYHVSACRCHKRVLVPQELKLQMIVSCLVGAGHQIQFLERQLVLLTTEPSLQAFGRVFMKNSVLSEIDGSQ